MLEFGRRMLGFALAAGGNVCGRAQQEAP